MTCLPAFAAGLSGEVAIAGEASVLIGDILTALAAGFCRELAVLTEAPLFIGHALAALGRDCTLLFGVHGSETAI